MNKQEFLDIVLAELNTIKRKMSQEEIVKRLNFDTFDHTQRNGCILAQLVFPLRSVSAESHDLVRPTFETVDYSDKFPRYVGFKEQSFVRGDKYTAIEKYFYMTRADKHKEVFDYLTGVITEIDLLINPDALDFQNKVDNAVNKLINGETISITDDKVREAVRTRLRDIKKHCTTVLSQLNEN